MELGELVVFAALLGLGALLPISESGHVVAARVWLGGGRALEPLTLAAGIGVLCAVVFVTRRRLGVALGEGLRGIARPAVLQASDGGRDATALVIGAVVMGAVEAALRPWTSPLDATPTAAGIGLLATAAAVASTRFAPVAKRTAPGPGGAFLAGVAGGLAVVPGASRIGAAFVLLRWLGLGGWRAAEMAMMMAVPALVLDAARRLAEHEPRDSLGASELVLAATVALLGGVLASAWWRLLCERERTPWLALWLAPLGLALVAYARGLGL
jgi:undecaprenyl-diphosphatase